MQPRQEAKFFRYGGVVVRLYKGRLDPVFLFGRVVRATRAAKHYAPLPAVHRRALAKQAARLETDARLRELNVTWPEKDAPSDGSEAPWADLTVASGAVVT